MYSGKLTPIPWGVLAGAPAIGLRFRGELPEAAKLHAEIAQALKDYPAIQTAWIAEAPWESEDFARLLDHALRDIPSIYGCQDLGAPHWGFRELTAWHIDASNVLRERPLSPAQVFDRVAAIPGFPAASEIVVQNIHPENLAAPVLDALIHAAGHGGTQAELRVAHGDEPGALRVIGRCRTAWHLRLAIDLPGLHLFGER